MKIYTNLFNLQAISAVSRCMRILGEFTNHIKLFRFLVQDLGEETKRDEFVLKDLYFVNQKKRRYKDKNIKIYFAHKNKSCQNLSSERKNKILRTPWKLAFCAR